MSSVLLSLSLSMFAVAQALTSLIYLNVSIMNISENKRNMDARNSISTQKLDLCSGIHINKHKPHDLLQ